MTIRPKDQTYQIRNIGIPQFPNEEILIDQIDVLGGVVKGTNDIAIPDNSFADLYGMGYLDKYLVSDIPYTQYSIQTGNTNPLLGLFGFTTLANGNVVLAFHSDTSIYRLNSTGAILVTGPVLSGVTLTSFVELTLADDRVFFTVDGKTAIYEINLSTNTYSLLGNSPNARHITAAFNRILGANILGSENKPYRIRWSGDLNYSEWNNTVDISSGYIDLVNSPADTSDEITGITVYASFVVVIRQKSIWIGINQPSATNPFKFDVDKRGIGCDCSRSLVNTNDGVMFYDNRSNGVYYYTPGNIKDISENVRLDIRSNILNNAVSTQKIFASYNAKDRVYQLFVGNVIYKYHLDTNSWTTGNAANYIVATDLDFFSSSTTIEELTGTIDALVGDIDSLSSGSIKATSFVGDNNGKIYTSNYYVLNQLYNVTVNSKIKTKKFNIPYENAQVSKTEFTIIPLSLGVITVSIIADNHTYQKSFNITSSKLTSQLLKFSKLINSRTLQIQIATTAMISLVRITIKGYKGGESK